NLVRRRIAAIWNRTAQQQEGAATKRRSNKKAQQQNDAAREPCKQDLRDGGSALCTLDFRAVVALQFTNQPGKHFVSHGRAVCQAVIDASRQETGAQATFQVIERFARGCDGHVVVVQLVCDRLATAALRNRGSDRVRSAHELVDELVALPPRQSRNSVTHVVREL